MADEGSPLASVMSDTINEESEKLGCFCLVSRMVPSWTQQTLNLKAKAHRSWAPQPLERQAVHFYLVVNDQNSQRKLRYSHGI